MSGYNSIMILNVPLYENNKDGNQCMQASMQSVLKYYLNKEFSLEELDILTNRKPNLWTYTPQIVSVLCDFGLNLKYYSKEDIEPFLAGESFFRAHYGKDADKILSFTDLPVVINSIKKLFDYDVFEKRIISIKEIEDNLSKEHLIVVLIDHNIINNIIGNYQGHAVVITGFDNNYIYYHDSGPSNPEPNKKASKETFEKAMNANGTDNDCIIIFGKK